jgi:hypothetical protein
VAHTCLYRLALASGVKTRSLLLLRVRGLLYSLWLRRRKLLHKMSDSRPTPAYAEKSWSSDTYTKHLRPHKVQTGQPVNLVDLTGGRYHIPDDQYDDFLRQYARECKHAPMALVEQKNEYFPMLFDIDHIEVGRKRRCSGSSYIRM